MNRRFFWSGFLAGICLTALALFLIVRHYMVQPDVSLNSMKVEDLNGQPINILGLLGKPIVVNYWATWCAPCRKEFPEFENAKRKYEGKVSFLMVSDEPAPVIQNFKTRNPYTFTFLKAVNGFEHVNVRPTTFIYDRNGKLVIGRSGGMSETELTGILDHM